MSRTPMKLILTQEVSGLGGPGDVVDVAAGYGRNYLIPRKLAVPAAGGAYRAWQHDIASREEKRKREREDADIAATRIASTTLTMGVKVGDKILFGKYSGQEFKLDGQDLLHMREDDVIGIVAAILPGFLAWSAIIMTSLLEQTNTTEIDVWIRVFEDLRAQFPAFPTPQIEAQTAVTPLSSARSVRSALAAGPAPPS